MSRVILSAIFIITLAGIAVSANISPAEDSETEVLTTTFGTYCIYKKKVTWDVARTMCRNQGEILVEISSNNEMYEIQSQMSRTKYVDSAWTGGISAQHGEDKPCAFIWDSSKRKVAFDVEEVDGDRCNPENARNFLRVQLLATRGLKAKHAQDTLSYICTC